MGRFVRTVTALIFLCSVAMAQEALRLPAAPEFAELSAEFAPEDFVDWQLMEIEGENCFVSPPLLAPAGDELNHNRVTAVFSGSGSLQATLIHSHADNLNDCIERHVPRFVNMVSGQEHLFTSRNRSQRFAWIVLRASGELEIENVRHESWLGDGTAYGHLAGTFNFSGADLKFRFMYPKDYDPQRSYPLLVSVGGSGGVGTNNVSSMENVIPARYLFTNYYDDEELQCFSLVAQIAPGDYIPLPYYPADPVGPGAPVRPYHPDWPLVNENGWYTQGTLALVEALIERDDINIDVDRVYYAGFSYGGKACWEFLKAGRETFAGAICVAGWPIGQCYSQTSTRLLPRLALEVSRYKHIPVYICAGDQDGMRFSSRAVHEEILRQGGESNFVEFPNSSHVSSAGRAWGNPTYFRWLFEQRRSDNPSPGADPFPEGNYATVGAP